MFVSFCMNLNSYSKYGKKYSYLNIWKILFSKRNCKKLLIANSEAVNSRREILLGLWERRILLNFVHFCIVSNHLCVLVAQLCLTLCDPMDCTLPGSSIHGILQARKLEWVAISFPTSPASPALVGGFFTSAPTGKPMGTSCQHLLLTKIFEEIRTGTWKSELGFWRGTNSSVISLTFSLQISGDFQRIYNLFCSEYKTKQNEKS